MFTVICVLMIHIETTKKDYWTSKELAGKVVEVKGDNWLVDFGNRVELVNSNACLIKETK